MEQPSFEEPKMSPEIDLTLGTNFCETDEMERNLERQAGLDASIHMQARQAGIAAGTIVVHKGVWTAAGRLTERQLEKARAETVRFLQQQES